MEPQLHCITDPYTLGRFRVLECHPVHQGKVGGRDIITPPPCNILLNVLELLIEKIAK